MTRSIEIRSQKFNFHKTPINVHHTTPSNFYRLQYNHSNAYLTSDDFPHPRPVFCSARKRHVSGESHCWRIVGRRACSVRCRHPAPEDGLEPGHRSGKTPDGKSVGCSRVLCETENIIRKDIWKQESVLQNILYK